MTANKQTMGRMIGLMRTERELTRQDLASLLGLSMPTTLQNVTGLIEAGIIEECGAAQSNGGRKARKLRLCPDAGWVVGINVALHQTEMAAINVLGEMQCSRTFPYAFQDTPEWYDALHDVLTCFVQEQIPAPVLGAGVSFPGTLDNPDMVSSHILRLSHMGLERFRRSIPYPVIFENDANSACRAEQRTAKDSFFYLSLNESVGGAVMLDGRVLSGDTFQAGEVGHVLLFPGGKRCYCGKFGCADAYLSPKALGDAPLDDFFARLKAGNSDARERWDSYLEQLSILLTNLRMLFNMDLIVGGEIGARIAPWLPLLREKAARFDLFSRDIDYIYPCAVKENACAAGAAKLALDQFGGQVLNEYEKENEKSMKQAAIFDMDGLLFDTERLYRDSWIEMAERLGQVPDPAFPRAICGTSGTHSLEVIRSHYPEVDAQAFLDGGIARVAERTAESVPIKPGAREILDFLRECGVKLAVASSSPREMILRNLEKARMKQYFDVVVSGQQVERGKPEPDIFLKAAELLGVPAQECYVFEDGVNGSRAGIAAGCVTVMVPDLTPPTPDLRNGCADICKSLLEALEKLEKRHFIGSCKCIEGGVGNAGYPAGLHQY